ncbi:Gfo/Idh/MocA family protein [Methylobacterium oxalidis]|uniref:Glucose-fructose oxidoreductase n=1 Tax=Methylobacterium oxalidis TaxID=944322 RepID=A0A512J4Y8_9HYPH|nr:Gfo/Idh/MocA family oxidoreductase [Methylobacterium oxalidis]GEP05015.1 glucose-fructose oxidoreductase [Methylobacterium oxalidis]GJE34799.1 Glucose--fructose oxidoreductase [Methylobacterium oxalidis]GLS63753.1 glucose-fructose oxidoreductase [Methylobacterium oxalidis]
MADDDIHLSRRNLLRAGGATLTGAALAMANPVAAAQNPPGGPAVPADTGAVQGGRVVFPNWRGPGDRTPPPPPAPMPVEKRVGFCLVGLGRLTLEELLPAFAECKASRVVALMSGSPDKAKLVAQQYGIAPEAVYGYGDWDRLKQNAAVQAVYVVTPNGMHREQVLAAAGAGKHVLCEKPMANSSAEARDMIAACERANVRLMIAYRCQYEPYNREVARLVRSGAFGKPRLIQAVNAQTTGLPEQWRLKKALAGGGALPDIGIYCLNTARAALGEEPVLVQAHLYSPADDPKFAEVEETVGFTLRFPSGVVAQCLTSYGVHEARRMSVHTPSAEIALENAFAYEGQRLVVSHKDGKQESRDNRVLAQKNQFALEIDHFARCVLENRRPRTPGEEGLQDHVLMEAIYESARTGAPVKVGPPAGTGGGLDVTRGPEPEEAG